MTNRSDNRRVISVTMQSDLHDQIVLHCKSTDMPMTVFIREAIRKALPAQPVSIEKYASDVLAYRASNSSSPPPTNHDPPLRIPSPPPRGSTTKTGSDGQQSSTCLAQCAGVVSQLAGAGGEEGRGMVTFDEPPGEARKSVESATKPRLELLPGSALEQIAEVLTYGAAKYEANNWARGARWGRYYAALLRHVFAWWRGEDHDAETGMSHLAHAGCCLLFLMEYQRNGWGSDDRFRGPDGGAFMKDDGAVPT